MAYIINNRGDWPATDGRKVKKVEDLVRLAAKPIAYAGYAIVLMGAVYLGLQLKGMARGGGELRKALAMIAAGGVVVAFAACYGFAGF